MASFIIKKHYTSRQKTLMAPLLFVTVLTLSFIYTYLMFLHQIQNISIHFNHRIDIYKDADIQINTTIDLQNVPETPDNKNQHRDESARDQQNTVGTSNFDCIERHAKAVRNQALPENYFNGSSEMKAYITKKCKKKSYRKCKRNLKGKLHVNMTNTSLGQLKEIKSLSLVQNGGWWHPEDCLESKKVAIIVPYRDREEHLALLLRYLHPILQRQQLHYRIFIIEQNDDYVFNRGKPMNVGFNEALKFFPYECFVFHDVDLLPEDDRNSYGCPSSPQHMCVALDKFEYKLLYEELFGGVEMFSKQHFKLVNGFSNSFWGWGAEDDNLYKRLIWKGLQLWRPSTEYARYKMMKHVDQEAYADPNRFAMRAESYNHFDTDGLINLQYDVKEIKEEAFHTLIKVNLRKDKDKMFGIMEFPKTK